MNFLKRFDIKGKFSLLKEFFHDYVWKKSLLNVGIASIIFSLGFIQFTTPQFYISTTLRESESISTNGPSGSGAQALFSMASSEGSVFNEFRSNLYSYVVAQRMWEEGWGARIFAAGDETVDINKIDRRHTISENISSFLLGYDLYDYYSPHDLQEYIAGKVSITKEIKGTGLSYTIF